ncbi:tigger transposable element-derived protein 4-like [Stegodyphus dumicola]|uniref:tigger transposable element-derived protein 4-like n=1 Tax=Stegodyphus dumicola TaxID=202533 RepID=UPI0015A80271|nr:tigger transposable element-derived protein 4-like [Stegodyphus dumicola]
MASILSPSWPQHLEPETPKFLQTTLVSELCTFLVSPTKMPRRDLMLTEKIGFLDKIKQQSRNTSQRRLVEITGLAKTTISRLIKQKDELREEWVQCEERGETSKNGSVGEGKDPDVDEALNEWFAIVTERSVRVSGPMLKRKAKLAKTLDHDDFKATDGWLSRWKSRHDIKFKKAHGEKESADSANAEEWKSTKLPELLENFSVDDIYNADETGLY